MEMDGVTAFTTSAITNDSNAQFSLPDCIAAMEKYKQINRTIEENFIRSLCMPLSMITKPPLPPDEQQEIRFRVREMYAPTIYDNRAMILGTIDCGETKQEREVRIAASQLWWLFWLAVATAAFVAFWNHNSF